MVAGGESAPGPAVREAHLRDYWKIVWQGRWTILAIFAVSVGATAVWTFMQTPIYRATATVEVQPQARRVLAGGDVSGLGAAGYGWFAEEKYHNTQVEIIRSRDVSRRVVLTLGLKSHPMFAEHPDPIEALRGMIQVDPRRDTGLLEISFTGADPQEIAQWSNAVAQAYVDRNIEKARDNVDNAMQAIKKQMVSLRVDLTEAEESRINALQGEEGEILNSMKQEQFIHERLQTFNTQLTAARIELNSLDNTLSQIRRRQQEGLALTSLPEFATNASLKELQDTRLKLLRDLEGAKVDLGPAHPEYAQQQAALETVEGSIENKISLIVAELEAKLVMARTKEQYLQEQILLTETFSVKVARATSRYDIVTSDFETTKQIYDMIGTTIKEVQLSHELMNNNITVLDEAMPPLFPIAPRRRVNLIIGAMFGMFLGLGAVFFLDYLDNTIRTPEDVERFLGLTVIGVVPKMRDGEEMTRALKEAYQSLRTSIIFSSKNRQRKVALITSASPREGKSSTVKQLGAALAAAGDRVVILDCDLRRPTQHVHHKLEREPGVTNYLAAPAEDRDWSVYLKSTRPANLHIMTSGPLPPSPPDLLGNERFKAMLAAMRESYDWVLIDSPPAATLADATLLASLADMVVLVVQHNATDRDHVVKTVHQMRSVNPNFAGVVLNNVDIDRAYSKDYYYAGYYYESGEEGKGRRFKKKNVERKAQVG